MPLGWWVWTPKWPPERGDYVAMRDPPFWPHHILLKRVEGVAGDTFCWRDGRHWINDRPMPEARPAGVRHGGAKPRPRLHHLARLQVLEAGEIAGFGDGGLRYGVAFFGPVDDGSFMGRVPPF